MDESLIIQIMLMEPLVTPALWKSFREEVTLKADKFKEVVWCIHAAPWTAICYFLKPKPYTLTRTLKF